MTDKRKSLADQLKAKAKPAIAAPSPSPPLANRAPLAMKLKEISFPNRPPVAPTQAAAEAERALRARNKRTTVKLTAAQKRDYHARVASQNAPPAPPAAIAFEDRRVAAEKVARAIANGDTRVAEPRPSAVPASDARQVAAQIAAGAKLIADGGGYDLDGPVVGFDFGTSSVKIVARWWFAAGQPAFALAVPPAMRSGELPHLWQTVLWVGPSGQFSLLPEEGYQPVDGFKAALITGQAARYGDTGVSPNEAATAFLALQFARLFGALVDPAGARPAAGIRALHLGIPVSTMDDRGRMGVFESIVCAALALVPQAEALTVAKVRAGVTLTFALPFHVFPELAGIVAGYAQGADRHVGPNLIMDCGAATLDIATFNLVEDQGGLRVSTFEARVATLGAEAIRWATEGGASEEDFLSACFLLDHSVFRQTAQHRAPAEFGLASPRRIQVVTVGGGFGSALHQRFVANFAAFYGRPLLRPMAKGPLVCDGDTNYLRLLLADGLARDALAIPEFRSPSEIEDTEARTNDPTAPFIGPEQM